MSAGGGSGPGGGGGAGGAGGCEADGMRSGPDILRCPLCGAMVRVGGAACTACPVSRGCGMIACPECGYRFVERSAVLDWFGRAWRRLRGGSPPPGGARDRVRAPGADRKRRK